MSDDLQGWKYLPDHDRPGKLRAAIRAWRHASGATLALYFYDEPDRPAEWEWELDRDGDVKTIPGVSIENAGPPYTWANQWIRRARRKEPK